MKSSLLALAAVGFALTACSGGEDATGDATVATADTAAAESAADTAAAPAEEDIQHYLLQAYPDAAPMRYALAWHDLNGDGADEAIVYMVSPFYCGTGGCNTLVLTPAGPMWSEVANISVSRTPIGVAETSTNGWQDLIVAVSGGGGEAGFALLKFDGEAYPSNPTVAPAEMAGDAGTVLIVEEPEFVQLDAGDPTGS